MSQTRVRLKITTPAELFVSGRGFYQLEESALYVQIARPSTDSRFFSYLEAPDLRLDFDRAGRLLFIEVSAGRHTWQVDEHMTLPTSLGYADIRWLDFRSQIPPPSLLTNRERTTLLIRFDDQPISHSYALADTVIVQTTEDSCLARIIITDIKDDLAGQDIAAFRKANRPDNASDR